MRDVRNNELGCHVGDMLGFGLSLCCLDSSRYSIPIVGNDDAQTNLSGYIQTLMDLQMLN